MSCDEQSVAVICECQTMSLTLPGHNHPFKCVHSKSDLRTRMDQPVLALVMHLGACEQVLEQRT